MKKIYIAILATITISCTQTKSQKQLIDTRPKSQIGFLKQLAIADSGYSVSGNEINDAESLDSAKAQIEHFVIDSLKSKIEQWHAFVQEVSVQEWPTKYIEVTLLVPNNGFPDKKYPQYDGIILRAAVSFEDVRTKNMLKGIQNNDKVLLSGKLQSTDEGNIDYKSYRSQSTLFTNPQFELEITDIKKL